VANDAALYASLTPEQRAVLESDGIVLRGLPEGVWDAVLEYVAPKIVAFDEEPPTVKLGWHWLVDLDGREQAHEVTTSMATGSRSTVAKVLGAIAPEMVTPGAVVSYKALAGRKARLAVVPNADGGMDITYMKAASGK
jgi:hypothetical protein